MRGGGWTDGANWVLTYIKNNSNSFPPASTIFEFKTLGREVDIIVGSIRYELKSVISLPPTNFVAQFTKDLDEVTRLEDLIWVFKKDKLSSIYHTEQEFVEKMLDEVRKLGLGQTTIDRFVGATPLLPNPTIDDLINLLRSKGVFKWQ
jgi:hypothetical protein